MATADWTLICSEDRRRQIEPAKPQHLAVIYNSPLDSPVATNAEAFDPTQKDFKIVYIGGLSPYRCLPELLGAVEKNRRCHSRLLVKASIRICLLMLVNVIRASISWRCAL